MNGNPLLGEKTFYVTKEKLAELQQEYAKLAAFEHNKITGEEAPKVLESEDLNAEFVSYQEDIDSMRLRMDELKNIIDNHQIISKPPKEKQALVNIGAKVHVDINGQKEAFRIVGTLEANPDIGHISNESPVGAALLGRKVGDEITIPAPKKTVYKIKDITYEVG